MQQIYGENIVSEWCPYCETEVEMRWDVGKMGYKAFCPICGNRLMLCDACQHTPEGGYRGDCDYCTELDSCRYNQKEDKDLLYILRFAVMNNLHIELQRLQLRALWTSYCMKNLISAGTDLYNTKLGKVWAAIETVYPKTQEWADKQGLKKFLSVYVI